MGDSFFIRESETRFVSTDWTRGPWDPRFQHGGPPAALLGHAVERAGPGLQVARIAFDLLKPVPVAPLEVDVEVMRGGKRVNLVTATLSHEGETAMRATAWLLRIAELDLPAAETETVGAPEGVEVEPFPMTWGDTSYIAAMEWRFVRGSFLEAGPATAWLRMRIPLVDDDPIDPLSRVLTAADSGSGISAALDWDHWVFVNPELTVHLFRYPVGDWVCLEAETVPHPNGIGLARSTIYDEKGRIGSGGQSLFVDPR